MFFLQILFFAQSVEMHSQKFSFTGLFSAKIFEDLDGNLFLILLHNKWWV